MASQTGICKLALIRMGEPPITSLDDGSKAANTFLAIWDTVIDIVLRDHPWNFAIARAIPPLLDETPTWGFASVFQLPGDCVRVLGIGDSDGADINPLITYKIEGRKLYTDETAVYLKYVTREISVGMFDARFTSAVASRLGMETAIYLTQKPEVKAQMQKEYILELSGARGIDAQEDTPQEVVISGDWEDSRL